MKDKTANSIEANSKLELPKVNPLHALFDLVVFLLVMFLVRTIHFESIGFWGNTLFKSISTVGVATMLLYYRKQSWRDLGLTKPKNLWKMLGIVAISLAATIISIMFFEIFLRDLFANGNEIAVESESRFSQIEGNIPYFFRSYFSSGLNLF